MLTYPNISPIALEIGPLVIRWYSLAYVVGILGGWYLIGKMNKLTKLLNKKQYDDLMTWAILGIVLGGRLGYVAFYNPVYFLQHWPEIFMLWQGGMSFHGGMVGMIVAIYIFSAKNKVSFFKTMDMISAVAPIGLFFGRIANFINAELYGRITQAKLGVVFPNAGLLARHPSQLYEAMLEGLVLFIILSYLFWKKSVWKKAGHLSGWFLVFYGLFRIVCELFREPDTQIGFLAFGVTMGQLLSIPMIIVGVFLLFRKAP